MGIKGEIIALTGEIIAIIGEYIHGFLQIKSLERNSTTFKSDKA
jgi:hypothetical protein